MPPTEHASLQYGPDSDACLPTYFVRVDRYFCSSEEASLRVGSIGSTFMDGVARVSRSVNCPGCGPLMLSGIIMYFARMTAVWHMRRLIRVK